MHSLRSMNNTATWTYYHCMHAKAHAESTHGQVLVWPVGCLLTRGRGYWLEWETLTVFATGLAGEAGRKHA
jgi:hypothetical protein